MPPERRLAAILSADVAGYSRLMSEDEQGTIQTLTAYRSLISSLVSDHHGRVVDSPGDNVLAEFPNALDSVQCAVEIQGVLRVRNQSLAENRRMLFRIGVHLGDITAEGEQIYGDGVNIAARLEGLAAPGGICISGEVQRQVENKLDLAFEDLGEQSVKNIPRPVRVYAVELGTTAERIAARPRRGTAPKAATLALTALAALLLSALGVWTVARPAKQRTPAVTRFVFALPDQRHLVAPQGEGGPGLYPPIAISHDGQRVAYVAERAGDPPRLYLRELDRLEARPLPGTDNAELPFFSPDGRWVGFLVNDTVFKVSVDGGNPVEVGDVPGQGGARGAAWGPDDTMILGGSNMGLLKLDAGGTAVEITRPNSERGEQYHSWPEVLPDGEHVLFTAVTGMSWDIGVVSLKTGQWRILKQTDHAGQPHYLDSGLLVFLRAGGLFATPFDLSEMELGDVTIPVLDDPFMGWNAGLDIGFFAVSRSGSLIYVPADPAAGENRLVLVDREGREEPLPAESGRYGWGPSVSPNGKRLAVSNRTRGSNDVWIHEIDQRRRIRLTADGANIFPVWTADGTRVIFSAFKSGSSSFELYWTAADGAGEPEPLLIRDYGQHPSSLSPDGRLLVFGENNPRTGGDIYLLQLDGDREVSPLVTTPANEGTARVSPDGRFLAFVSDETGRNEVYVQPLSGGGALPISADGGRWPRWSPSGSELFYRRGATMMAASIQLDPTLSVGTPRALFSGRYETWYDVMPGGEKFVMLARDLAELTELKVVVNWSAELDRLSADN